MQSKGARIEVEHLPGVTLAKIAGVIDEHFDQAQVVRAVQPVDGGKPVPVLIDIEGVARITSYGVREWVNAFRAAGPAEIFFVGCRPALVAQFNSVPQFGACGAVVTLFCPYVCGSCGKDFEVLTDVRKVGEALRAFRAPEVACVACGRAPAEFDDVEQSYFSSLVERPLAPLPPVVEAALDGQRPTPQAQPLRIYKDVAGDVTALWLTGPLDGKARLKRHADGLEGDTIVLLAGLTGTDGMGVARLGDVLRADSAAGTADGLRLFLARVPVDTALRLAAEPEHLGRAAVLSVVAAASCSTCGPVSADVTACIRQRGAATCPTCNASLDVSLEDLASSALAGLPWREAPEAVAAYLAGNPVLDPGARAALEDRTPSKRAAEQIGKYEIVRRIGVGGMAEVYLGRHIGLEGFEKKVVIKKILPHLAVQPTFVEQFLQEARVAARLAHPHIVQIFDLGRDGQSYFIVMELVNGHDFNALIRMATRLNEQLPIGVAVRIVASLCRGLHAAHTYTDDDGTVQPVLHRDVSPHNVLVGFDGAVKITDFGVAKASGSLGHTSAGTLKGKVLYMAPEHVLGQAADQRIDIFAAGLCLYYALVQQHPFARTSEVGALKAVLEADIRPPSMLRPDVSADLERIVMKSLERDPARRYASAEEMAVDLDRYLAQAPESTLQHVGEWVRGLDERMASLPVALRPLERRESDATVTTPEGPLQQQRPQIARAANGPVALPFDVEES